MGSNIALAMYSLKLHLFLLWKHLHLVLPISMHIKDEVNHTIYTKLLWKIHFLSFK